MIEFLRQAIESCDGGAPVAVLTTSAKSYFRMVLYAVDEVGVVMSDARTPGVKRAYPWSGILAIQPDQE